VENNGVNPLILSGNFSVYQSQRPGALIFQTSLIPTTVAPNSTAVLLGELYWLPPAPGTYNVAAHVTANRRNLFHDFGPLALVVTNAEPPEPPIVTAHATQHETGGADEVNVTNLRGECYDPQPPKVHAGRHEQGGADQMNVNGLKGQLADAQPVSVHGNEAHSEPFATETKLGNHESATTAHTLATNLEKTANKAQANGYPSLGADKLIPDAQLPASLERTNNKGAANGYAGLDASARTFVANSPASRAAKAELIQVLPPGPITVMRTTIPANSLAAGDSIEFGCRGFAWRQPGHQAVGLTVLLLYTPLGLPPEGLADFYMFPVEGGDNAFDLVARVTKEDAQNNQWVKSGFGVAGADLDHLIPISVHPPWTVIFRTDVPATLEIQLVYDNAYAGDYATVWSSYIQLLHRALPTS
jgi:hypothetical protein